MLIIISKIISVLINFIVIINVSKQIKYKKYSIFYFFILVFEVFFVMPIFLDIITGYPNLSKYPGFHLSQTDKATNLIYCLFIIVTPIIFYKQGKKMINIYHSNISLFDQVMEFIYKINKKRYIVYLLYILSFTPVVLAFFSPNPTNYFCAFAPFIKDVEESALYYHSHYMKYGLHISFFSILLLRLSISRRKTKKNILCNMILYLAILFTVWFSGKRTLPSLLILGIMVIDIFKLPKGKSMWKNIIITGVIIIGYFYLYTLVTDKHLIGLDSYDMFRVYFGRDAEVKMAIYGLLYPEKLKILDFAGQSYLFDLTFFIPRSIWPNKPWPYATYFTNSLLGLPSSSGYLGWHMTTSWFGEAIANLGWFGFPFGIWTFIIFGKISEKRQNIIVMLISIVTLSLLMVLHFSANITRIIVWVLSLVIFRSKRNLKADITKPYGYS